MDFSRSIGIKALPKSKSKEQYFIPQKTKERQWTIKTVSSEEHPLAEFTRLWRAQDKRP